MKSFPWLIAFVAVALAYAQQTPFFDVAALKPADPSSTRFGMGFSGNGRTLTVNGLNPAQMIRLAYGVSDELMSVSPSANIGWVHSDKYDINAKFEGTTSLTKEQSNQMFRQLLAERFGVKLHHESKVITVYSLVVENNGAKLSPGGAAGPYLSGPAPGKLVGQKASMGSLVSSLGGALGRPVLDETGLTGGFDFTLTWTPDTAESTADTNGPSLFTAIQDQLGLKLESKKVAMDAIVVDSAAKPSAN